MPRPRAPHHALRSTQICSRLSIYYAKAKANGTLVPKRPGDTLPAYASAERWTPIPVTWGFGVGFGDGRVINARAETHLTKPLFAGAQPAVVAAQDFEEHGAVFARADGKRLALAALVRPGPDGPELVLLTRPATGVVAAVHPRMPAILEGDQAQAYLRDKRQLPAALCPHPVLVRVA